ncbi:30S ribosomal protein S4 [Candidatus Woesearchaeota archaeon]|nr:30S ribosomal protein S4 [Candidatus Woesearchaeota archaeon]
MGDPRRIKKKFSGPRHPWQKSRLEVESKIISDYGLKTKRELWRMGSKIKDYSGQAKKLIAAKGSQAEKEKQQLFKKLQRIGLLGENPQLDNILDLTVTSILDRRLQTLVHKKGLARTPSQARQFITHNHISLGSKSVSVPSYIVPVSEESSITFVSNSSLFDSSHPERSVAVTKSSSRSGNNSNNSIINNVSAGGSNE